MGSNDLSEHEAPIHSTLRRSPAVMALVATFVEALPGLCEDISCRVQAGDLTTAAALAHRLKGSAGGYGFAPVQAMVSALEERAVAGDALACGRLAIDLSRLAGRVRPGAPEVERGAR